jgi:hypothetical protein
MFGTKITTLLEQVKDSALHSWMQSIMIISSSVDSEQYFREMLKKTQGPKTGSYIFFEQRVHTFMAAKKSHITSKRHHVCL